jgi:hypothetical protein
MLFGGQLKQELRNRNWLKGKFAKKPMAIFPKAIPKTTTKKVFKRFNRRKRAGKTDAWP